jgi:hypothetical protein
MTPDEGFASSRFLIDWSKAKIEELDAEIKTYLQSDPVSMIKEFNPKNGHTMLVAEFRPLPMGIKGLTNDVINNLRHALDQSTNAACFMIRGTQKRNTHFPFGSDPSDFDKAIQKAGCSDILPELYPVLKSLEPYPPGDGYLGGNRPLRLLGYISGPHKHRFSLSPAADSMRTQIQGGYINTGAGGVVLPRAKAQNNKITIISLGPGGQAANVNVNIYPYIAFNGGKVDGIPVDGFLKTVAKIVEDAHNMIEATAREITEK